MSVSVLKRCLPLAVAWAVALLGPIGAAPASAASPWWQVRAVARPTNMWEPKDAKEDQEVKTESLNFFGFAQIFAAEVEVGGSVVGCLGSGGLGALGGPSADEVCEGATGFPASESAAELKAMLEGPYGPGKVEVSGGPAGSAPFQLGTRWGVPPVKVTPIRLFGEIPLGAADSTIVSEGSGRLVLALTNLGDGPVDGSGTPVTIVDKLPQGVVAYGVEAVAGRFDRFGPIHCSVESTDEVACGYKGKLPPYEAIEVEVLTALEGTPPVASAPGKVTVSGGEAPATDAAQSINVSDEHVRFGVEQFSAVAEEEGGKLAPQAGRHPFQFTTTLQLNSGATYSTPNEATNGARWIATEQPALPRNLRFSLPAGLVGNATTEPSCDVATFLASDQFVNHCADDTVIGVSSVTVVESKNFGLVRIAVPVFNLPPNLGEPARFGFMVAGDPVIIDTTVDPDRKYRIVASVSNISQLAQFLGATTTLWGTPGDSRHDNARGWGCVYNDSLHPSCERPADLAESAFLRQPVQCSSQLDFGLDAEPWNVPLGSEVESASFTGDPLSGCNRVPFDPTISAAPTSKLAENPSGLDFKLTMPNSGLLNKEAIAEGQPEKVEVTLPEGVTINPSEGEGLVPCMSDDYGRETAASRPGEGCPEVSKIGNVQIATPLLGEVLNGALYLATPYENQFHTLVALYLVARAPESGVIVKLAGEVIPNPVTGQLVTTFEETPQLPFSSFKLHFREGGRAPLVTPPTCGTYQMFASMVPWSAASLTEPAPDEIVTRTSSFTIERGVDGGACPTNGTPPFAPSMVAGTQNNAAGSYSPFYLRIERKDGEQEITGFSTQLPPGLTGNLTGIPFCGEANIARARGQSGAEAQADPACPAASRIGHTIAEAGVGSILAHTPGELYLGGPFEGAPLSLVSVTSAKVGPFDLGTVVVHLPLQIDPHTAQVSIPSGPADQIPHILKGVVIHLRAIRVYVDRQNFMINPTSCAPMSLQAGVVGSGANFASAADDVTASDSERFQDANCASLAFEPRFKVSTSAKTSRKNGASLHVALTYPKDSLGKDTNIKSVHVELPKELPSRLSTLNHACVDSVFNLNPADCPAESRVGFAKAVTPALPVPLEGPAYFVSHGGQKFPELIVVLQGYGITVELAGETFISKTGVTSSTFEAIPDVPVQSFELTLPEGKYSALAANTNLCTTKLAMPTKFTGQNGAIVEQKIKIAVSGCKPAIHVAGHSVNGSRAKIRVTVPSAGTLVATGADIKRSAERVAKSGTVTIGVTLAGRGLRVLARHPHQRVNANVKLTFRRAHSAPLTAQVKLLLE